MRGIVTGWSMRLGLGRYEGVMGRCAVSFSLLRAVFLSVEKGSGFSWAAGLLVVRLCHVGVGRRRTSGRGMETNVGKKFLFRLLR
jgi:hypothetical protein